MKIKTILRHSARFLTVVMLLLATMGAWAQSGSRQLIIQSAGGGEVEISALNTTRTVRNSTSQWTIYDQIVQANMMTASLKFTADAGYYLKSVVINDMYNVTKYVSSDAMTVEGKVNPTTGSIDYIVSKVYTISNVVGDVKIVAVFEPYSTATDVEAYAVLSENETVIGQMATNVVYGRTLTFYYDNQRVDRNGLSIGPFSDSDEVWGGLGPMITTVEFSSSFANYTSVTSTAKWFYGLSLLTTITGISNLKTNNVTSMKQMFYGCSSLTSIDLTDFNTASVANMSGMFQGCSQLAAIYVGSGWNIGTVTAGDNMFTGCVNLIGGAGTAYSQEHTDYFYACIDGGPNSQTPGYLTDKNAPVSVSAPVFSFEGDNLKMETETTYASIFYKVANLSSMDDAVVESVKNSLTVTANDQESTQYVSPFELVNNAVVKAIAVMTRPDNTFTSDVTTLVYDYSSWVNLKAAIESAKELVAQASGNSNVNASLLEQLQQTISQGESLYLNRATTSGGTVAQNLINDIGQLSAQVEAQVNADDEPYALLEGDTISGMTLRFYYDKQKLARGGMSVGPFASQVSVPWNSSRKHIVSVVFENSFANVTTLTSTAYLFAELYNLQSITGISNLKTDHVTNMQGMFMGCRQLTDIDLSGFNTGNVTTMNTMFQGCTNLTTVYVGSNWSTASVTAGTGMFTGCTNLVGGTGTPFDANHTDHTYARIDKGPDSSTPGYFTPKDGYAESPTFSWDGNALTMSTVTEDAEIFYSITATDARGRFVAPADPQTLYQQPVDITGDCTIAARAVKENMGPSDVVVLNYPYKAWNALVEAVNGAKLILTESANNPNVNELQRDTLTSFVSVAEESYSARTDSVGAINQLTNEMVRLTDRIRQQVYAESEPYALLSENNTVLTFYYDKKKIAQNGMSVGPLTLSYNTQSHTNVVDGRDWESYVPNITSVVFDQSFANYTGLTTTDYWFYGYSKLTSIVGIENLKTANATSMARMFWRCSSLTSLDLSHFNTDKVTDMVAMFSGCSALTSLDVSSFSTESVTSMSQMFSGCSRLTSLDLGNFNTSNVLSVDGMFEGCSALTSFNLSNFNTENVTNMSMLFNECQGLSTLDLSSFNTGNVTDMQSMFEGCSGLTSLDLSGFNVSKVTTTAYMFSGCTSLTTIYASGDWNENSISESDEMFGNCTSLKGGAGTVYDEENVDVAYARIDGGQSAPGYFTDKNASPITVSVSAPVFSFEGDNLKMETETANASIFYKVADLPSMDDAVVESVKNGLIVTADGQGSTRYDGPFELTKAAVVKAIAVIDGQTGIVASDTTTLVYDYSAWSSLKTAIEKGTEVYNRAKDNSGVETSLKEQLQSTLEEGNVLYRERATTNSAEATNFTQRITELSASVEAQMDVPSDIEVIGNTDCSSAWWSAFSQNYVIPVDQTLHLQFINHSDKVNNWDNWVLLCTADTTRTPEYFALRADRFGWGDYHNANGFVTNWTDMDVFREAMDGALVDMTVRRNGSIVTVTSVAHAASGLELTQQYTTEIAPAASQPINVFLTVENCYLELYKSKTKLTPSENPAVDEPYAILSENNTVLTFYYDKNKSVNNGMSIGANQWDNYKQNITKVVFDASFANCSTLTSTSRWFNECSNLESIEGITNLNTANVTDMSYMFARCYSLTSLDVSSFNTEKVTNMSGMFWDCRTLKTLNVANFNTTNVTDMTNMFRDNVVLESVDVSNFNTGNVANMSRMFEACFLLKTLDLSSFNTANVTDMSYMLESCRELMTVYVGDGWSTANVTNGTDMFTADTKLTGGAGTTYDANHTDYTYAHIDGGQSAPGYFTDKNATPITVSVSAPVFSFEGDNLKMETETANASIFYKVADLPSMADAVVDSVKNSLVVTADAQGSTRYDGPFLLTKAAVVKAIAVVDGQTGIVASDTTTLVYDYSAWMSLKAAIEKGTEVYNRAKDNSDVETSLKEQLQWALEEGNMLYRERATMNSFEATHFAERITELCAQIEAQMSAEAEPYAVLSDNYTVLTFYYDKQKSARDGMSVGPFEYSGDRGWYSLSHEIRSVVFDTSFANCTSITSTEFWFLNCSRLATITGLENLKTEHVTTMGNMFQGCSSLTSLDLSSFNTENLTSMRAMFNGCANLTTVYVGSGWSTASVTTSTDMFNGCTNLVGGAGTTYDANHIDHTYAHIDGGSANPGYFTDKNASPITVSVSAPVFSFEGDNLKMESETANASIFYKVADLPSMADAVVDSVKNSLVVTADVDNITTTHNESVEETLWEGEAIADDRGKTFLLSDAGIELAAIEAKAGQTVYFYFTPLEDAWKVQIIEGHWGPTYASICSFGNDTEGGKFTEYDLAGNKGKYALVLTQEMLNAAYTQQWWGGTFVLNGDNIKCTKITTMADAQGSTRYDGPFELTRSAVVKAIAVIDGQTGIVASDTTMLVYDYSAWSTLKAAIEKGTEVYNRAKDNNDVETSLKEQLQWALEEGNMLYRERATMNSFEATHFAERITELCAQIEAQMNAEAEPYAVLSENNTVLTFYYDKQKSSRGGIDINQSFIDSNSSSPYGSATTAVFDASFANYRPTSTAYWFMYCSSLTSITGMENLNTANVTDMTRMFDECRSLTSLDLSNFNTQNVTSMNMMFTFCLSLTSLDLSKFNTENVTDMSGMFLNCAGLTLLDVSGLKTDKVTTMTRMFEGCSRLTSLDVSTFNTSNVTNMGSMFSGCQGMTTINVSGLNTENVLSMRSMFERCENLTTLDISGFNTQKVTDMSTMFYGCNRLTTIYVGEGWSTESVGDGTSMFNRCVSLVGGAGTAFSADHTDYTYAHIDGGTANPGYFTDKNATPMEKVATPTFSWDRDNLTISCATDDATIMYLMSDEDTNGDGVITDADYKQYSAPVEVKRNVIIQAMATKQGMTASDVITLDYPYESWAHLYETIQICGAVAGQARQSGRVPADMLDTFKANVAHASMRYDERTSDRHTIENMDEELRRMASEIDLMMQIQASYANNVLTVGGNTTMAEAIEKFASDATMPQNTAAIIWNSSVELTENDLQRFTNPNLLIYAQTASEVPVNRDNVVIDGVAKNVVLSVDDSLNCMFYAPRSFTAEAIQYTREFRQQTQIGVSRGWETIALPFTVQTFTHADKGVIAPFGNNASDTHFWLRELTQNGLQPAQTIEANKPYLISMPNSEEYRPEVNLAGSVTFSAQNATVSVTEEMPVEYGTVAMVPSFQTRNAQADIYVLNVGEVRDGNPEGSVFERNYRAVRPFEAYTLHRDNPNPAPQFIPLNSLGGGDATGIEELVDKRISTNDTWYTIDGRKLQSAPTGKGLYIKNGRKTVVK